MVAPVCLSTVSAALAWLGEQGVRALCADSRLVTPGDGLVAWPGWPVDTRHFVSKALAAGARAAVVDAQGVQAFDWGDAPVACLADLKQRAGELASRFWGEPSGLLSVLAVTGTNGKTSCTWWLAQALQALGRRCGLVGTLGMGEPDLASLVPTGLTTPDPVRLQQAFHGFVQAGFSACAMEASSIGLVENRLAGTHIEVAVLTNFTQDHLDFHGSMQAYWQAKNGLFDWLGLRASVVNLDDAQGALLAAQLRARGADVWGVSAREHGDARLRASQVRYEDGGLVFTVHEGGQAHAVATRLMGAFNVSNLLAVLGGLRALGVALEDAVAVCADLSPVPGRMQVVVADEFVQPAPCVVVDYAHTPDALAQALAALRPLALAQGGLLWVVFGCGGNRDAGKRPLMARSAELGADRVVMTSDNPRFESADEILAQMAMGLVAREPVVVMADRAAAIGYALAHAGAKDVVLLAGKGHETTQEVAGVKRPFSDVLCAKAALADRAKTGRVST